MPKNLLLQHTTTVNYFSQVTTYKTLILESKILSKVVEIPALSILSSTFKTRKSIEWENPKL